MNGQIIELYTDADLAQMHRHVRCWKTVLWSLGGAALAVCLVLVALTGTGNAARMEAAVIAVSTLVGWVVIYGALFVVAPARRTLAHAAMLRVEERQTLRGAVTVTGQRVAIRNSITARRVEVQDADETVRVLVCEDRAEALAAARPSVLYTCHGYVAAYEVTTCGC